MSLRRFLPWLLAAALGCATPPADDGDEPRWERLETEPANDRQDDVSFIDAENGWYVNSLGKIFKTSDGGRTWKALVHRPGTYWRSILFLDAERGFAGNLGPGAIEGFRSVMAPGEWKNLDDKVAITDDAPLYETLDGGGTWTPALDVPRGPGGICSISSVALPGGKTMVFAGGRVTGPPLLFRYILERRWGWAWTTIDVSAHCGMVLDVKFFDERRGILCAATTADPATARASILTTSDGGETWEERYRSTRPGESVWKCSFPTADVGYATIRPFVEDRASTLRYVLKTVDGGRTWSEIILVDDYDSRPQAVAFLTPERGWVGTTAGGFETRDGGQSWQRVDFGRSINRIRILEAPGGGYVLYAIGQDFARLSLRAQP